MNEHSFSQVLLLFSCGYNSSSRNSYRNKSRPASGEKMLFDKPKLVIRGRRGRGLEIAHPDYDPAHTHEISTLVGTAHVASWSLHMNEAAFGNGARDIGRFGTLAEPIQPVRSVFLRD